MCNQQNKLCNHENLLQRYYQNYLKIAYHIYIPFVYYLKHLNHLLVLISLLTVETITLKKHLYKERYLEQKRKKEWEKEMYKKYNGEKNYYKQSLIDFGYLVIKSS
jgi:hypothetical protein